MKSRQLTHSKYKNVGVLFELLVRQNMLDIMEKRQNSPSAALMQKYFSPITEMGKELQLYRAFFEIGLLNENKAIQLIDMMSTQRKKLNEKKLAQEKYEFIKEVKKHYNIKEFLNVKIPSYKVYASIHKTFLAEIADIDYSNIQDVAMSRFTLIEHLTHRRADKNGSKTDPIFEELKREPEDIRVVTLKLMAEHYSDRYKNIGPRQKALLSEYITSTSLPKITEYVKNESRSLSKEIRSAAGKEKDKATTIKLKEVANTLDVITSKTRKLTENDLVCVLIGYQIVDELKR